MLFQGAVAQNMARDGDFEKDFSKGADSLSWHSCSPGETPDHFNEAVASTYSKYRGGTRSFSGAAHAGLFVYRINGRRRSEVREFLCAPLSLPMKRDSFYHVEVFVRTDSESTVLTDGFALHFAAEDVRRSSTSEMLQLKVHVAAPPHKVIPADAWTALRGSYRAWGHERFVVLGNLKPDGLTHTQPNTGQDDTGRKKWRLRPDEQVSYVYIDGLRILPNDSLNLASHRKAEEKRMRRLAAARLKDSLLRAGDSLALAGRNVAAGPSAIDTAAIAAGEAIDLPMVQFETDRADFTTGAQAQLAELLTLMQARPRLVIEIRGHTDNAGTKKRNDQLSQARADAVARFLTVNGIAAERVQTAGFGSSRPIAGNDTEEGRAANRRIEIFIVHE